MVNSEFRARLHSLVENHPVVKSNPYTGWFATAALTKEEVARFTQQFSVFSHEFIVAQLRKVLVAPDIQAYRAGKEILLNELGVAFRGPRPLPGLTPDLAPSEGSVDGGTYRHASAHFEWLVAFAEPLGMTFQDLGKRQHATPETRRFCERLVNLYGSSDPNIAAGASYAIEHWAAAGFWRDLIRGLERFKESGGLPLNLGFWVFHDRLEQQHADHTTEELDESESSPGFDAERFLEGARSLLDEVQLFWIGLAANGPAMESPLAGLHASP
jgi:hypothetical protein